MTLKTKEKILASAKELIGEYGYNNTKVIDITKNAGISKGSFYTYFETKEDVFIELLENMLIGYRKAFENLEYEKNLKKDLENFIGRTYKVSFLDKEGIKIISHMFMSIELSERIIKIRNQFMKGVEEDFKELLEINIAEINLEAQKRISNIAISFEKLIRVYISSTIMKCKKDAPFGEIKELSSKEIKEQKTFLAETIYKALKK